MFKSKIKSLIKASLKRIFTIFSMCKTLPARSALFMEYIFYSFMQRCKKLPRNEKTIVFTLDDDKLYRDDDGMGRYAYLTLNLFSEAGYNVYLCKNIDSFRKFLRLGRYGRFMYFVKNLKIVPNVPQGIAVEETFYAFDAIDRDLIDRNWKQFIYLNILKPNFCKIGPVTWIPYYNHPIAYKAGMPRRFDAYRAQERKLRVFFAGNTVERHYSSKRFRDLYGQLPRFESITAVLELGDKVRNVENAAKFLKTINEGPYINGCWLVRTDGAVKLRLNDYWSALSRSDFFLCFSGTDYPMCHNLPEAMAAGTVPITGYAHWMSPPLEHGKNAIVFSDREDLKDKVNEVFHLSDAQVQAMRGKVIRYYEEHLSPNGFIKRFEADTGKVRTLELLSNYVPVREAENIAARALLEQLERKFESFVNGTRKVVSRPRISVIIPAYNRANKITAALQSIQAQSYSNWEAIVVDDASTDKTCDVVLAMVADDPRIRLVRHQQNRKAQAARNTGIKEAKGEWITFLDSDDTYLPDSLQARMDIAQRERVQVVHSECYIIKPDEEKTLYKIRPLSGHIYKDVLAKEGPVFPALLVKKSALEKIGWLDENIKSYQEWDTSIRLAKHFVFGFCAQPTFVYDYRSEDAMSRNPALNGRGYAQIFHKHFLAMWRYLGAAGLAFHYEKAARWYAEGHDHGNAQRCQRSASVWKCLSPKIVLGKAKSMLKQASKKLRSDVLGS